MPRGRSGGLGDNRQAELAKVFNVAYKFVGKHDEAEDLTQDIFLKIFKALATFDRRANFQTWIVSISRNMCIDHYRSVRKERQTIARDVDSNDLQPASSERGPYAAAEHQDLRELLRPGCVRYESPLRALKTNQTKIAAVTATTRQTDAHGRSASRASR